METIIVAKNRDHAGRNHIIPEEQHGFVSGRSTITNLLTSMDKWTRAIDQGESMDIVYLDYAKALARYLMIDFY